VTPRASRPVVAAGLVLAALYLATTALTGLVRGGHVLALFDDGGTGPSRPYQWVNPPTRFRSTNNKPTPVALDLPLASARTAPVGLQSSEPDPQLVVSLPAGAIPPRPGDATVHVAITPLDPATLGPLPAGAGMGPDGNAYRADFVYEPSGQPVGALASPGNVFLVVPSPGHGIAFSADGGSWQLLETQQLGARNAMGAVFSKPGYYLAAAGIVPPTRSNPPGGKGIGTTALLAGAGAALLVAVLAGVVLLRRGRAGARRRPR